MKKIVMMVAVGVLGLALQSDLSFAKTKKHSEPDARKSEIGERETCPECEKASSRAEKPSDSGVASKAKKADSKGKTSGVSAQ